MVGPVSATRIPALQFLELEVFGAAPFARYVKICGSGADTATT